MNTKQNIPEHWLKIIDRVKFYQENPLGFS